MELPKISKKSFKFTTPCAKRLIGVGGVGGKPRPISLRRKTLLRQPQNTRTKPYNNGQTQALLKSAALCFGAEGFIVSGEIRNLLCRTPIQLWFANSSCA